jgi:hypothetical protein
VSPRDFIIPTPAVFDAHRAHTAGWSLRAIARVRWREWGYASPDSAYEGLRHAMRALDLTVRSQSEATVEANLRHGHMRTANWAIDSPQHGDLLAHRRHLRAMRRDYSNERGAAA